MGSLRLDTAANEVRRPPAVGDRLRGGMGKPGRPERIEHRSVRHPPASPAPLPGPRWLSGSPS